MSPYYTEGDRELTNYASYGPFLLNSLKKFNKAKHAAVAGNPPPVPPWPILTFWKHVSPANTSVKRSVNH